MSVMTAEEAREALRIYDETGALSPDVYISALASVCALRRRIETMPKGPAPEFPNLVPRSERQ